MKGTGGDATTSTPGHTGYVKFFSEQRGFGFIQMEGGLDIFVAAKDVVGNPLYPDDKVSFELQENRKGKAATNVRGGTGNPCKGTEKNPSPEMKGRIREQEMAAKHAAKVGKDGKPLGKAGKGGPAKGRKGSDSEEDEETKGNDGKGFCPGAQREWIKGKPIPAHVPFRGLPPPVKGGQAALISQMLMSATGPPEEEWEGKGGAPEEWEGKGGVLAPGMEQGNGMESGQAGHPSYFQMNYAAPEFRPMQQGG